MYIYLLMHIYYKGQGYWKFVENNLEAIESSQIKQRGNFSKEWLFMHLNYGTDGRYMGARLPVLELSRWKTP